MLRQGERRVEQPVSGGDGEGENHAVRLAGLTERGLGGEAGDGLLGVAQGVGVDGVAVLGQQLGQLGLPQVAAHHPDVQFVFHRIPPGPPAGRWVSNPLYGLG